MLKIEINQIVNDVISYMGKQVIFSYKLGETLIENEGMVTSVVLNLNGVHEIALDDDGDFYSFSEIIDFKVLDAV